MQPHLFFLATAAGNLLITQFMPVEAEQTRLNVIVVPPFGEEMNKSRKMLSTFAREAANNNVKVSLIDLFGTGDSAGDFSAATWSIWQQNVAALYQDLQHKDPEVPIALVGLRTGGLLALDCCVKQNMIEPPVLMLWQPVLNGQQFINQFMRLRLAADMVNQQPKCTMNDLLDQLQQVGEIEIAGYGLSQALSGQIGRLNYLKLEQLPAQLKVAWLEVGQRPQQGLLPISQQVIAQWQRYNRVLSQFVVGDSFWQTQEITTAGALTNCSIAYLLEYLDE